MIVIGDIYSGKLFLFHFIITWVNRHKSQIYYVWSMQQKYIQVYCFFYTRRNEWLEHIGGGGVTKLFLIHLMGPWDFLEAIQWVTRKNRDFGGKSPARVDLYFMSGPNTTATLVVVECFCKFKSRPTVPAGLEPAPLRCWLTQLSKYVWRP